MFSNKRQWTGTAVSNTCGLADLSAGSSIKTRTVSAAAIATIDVTSTRNDIIMTLIYKIDQKRICFYRYAILMILI